MRIGVSELPRMEIDEGEILTPCSVLEEAGEVLGYKSAQPEIRIRQLLVFLNKLGCPPFTPEKLQRYQRNQINRLAIKGFFSNFTFWMGVLCFGISAFLGGFLFGFSIRTCLLSGLIGGVGLFAYLVQGDYYYERIQYLWQREPLEDTRGIPLGILALAIEIKKQFPEARFLVERLTRRVQWQVVRNPQVGEVSLAPIWIALLADPFLIVQLHGREFYIAQWNENYTE